MVAVEPAGELGRRVAAVFGRKSAERLGMEQVADIQLAEVVGSL